MTKKRSEPTSQKKPGKLLLSEHLTIDTVSDQIKKFSTLITKSSEIVFHSKKQIQTLDLSGIQTLIYFKEFCVKSKVKPVFQLKFEDTVSDLISKSGFPDLLKVLAS